MIRTAKTVLVGTLGVLGLGAGIGTLRAPGQEVEPYGEFRRLAAGADQHLVVVTDSAEEIHGRLFLMERTGGKEGEQAGQDWSQVAGPIPVVVGRSGVGPKSEGDGRSPEGVFPLGPAFGYSLQAPSGVRFDYEPMAQGDVCVDDPESVHYNRVFDPRDLTADSAQDWTSAEAMRRDLAHGDSLYQWGLIVGYNEPPVPGRGSCIFLHVWRGPDSPTSGCTAMDQKDLLSVLRWLSPSANPVLVQGDMEFLEELARKGVLPYPRPRS